MTDSNLTLPPMSDDVEELLRSERERPAIGAATADRMWLAISAEVAGLPFLGAAPASAVKAAAAPSSLSVVPGQIASGIGRLALVKALPWVVLGLGVGGIVAERRLAASRASGSPSSSVGSAGAAASPAPKPDAPAGPVASPQEIVAPATAPSSAALPAAPGPGTRPRKRTDDGALDRGLAEEEAMLKRAEAALRGGDWSAALELTEAYARRFPHGELAEENAYLGVRACLRGGDQTEARRRLRDFRRRFPLSPLGIPPGE